MKSTMVEGVPDSKIKRLQKHLLKVEKLTGMKLRRTPRYDMFACPIDNYAPSRDIQKLHLVGGYISGKIGYNKQTNASALKYNCDKLYGIYDIDDSLWWHDLSPKTCRAITKYISNWIKERNREK